MGGGAARGRGRGSRWRFLNGFFGRVSFIKTEERKCIK